MASRTHLCGPASPVPRPGGTRAGGQPPHARVQYRAGRGDGARCRGTRHAGRRRRTGGQRAAARRASDRAGIRGSSVRILHDSRGWPRHPPWRADHARRAAPRRAVEGGGPDPLLATWRRPGRDWADAAGVRDQRGHARARYSHDAQPRRGRHGRAGLSRARAVGRRADASGSQPPSRWHVRVGGGRGRSRRRACARRLRARSALRRCGRRGGVARSVRRDSRASGVTHRAVAARRLRPRRDEHGQHGHLGRDDRLRALRVHGHLRPRDRVQLDRRRWALRVRQSAGHRPVEPGAAGRDAAAAACRQSRERHRHCDRGGRAICRPVPGPLAARHAGQAWTADCRGRRCAPGRRTAGVDAGTARRLLGDIPAARLAGRGRGDGAVRRRICRVARAMAGSARAPAAGP